MELVTVVEPLQSIGAAGTLKIIKNDFNVVAVRIYSLYGGLRVADKKLYDAARAVNQASADTFISTFGKGSNTGEVVEYTGAIPEEIVMLVTANTGWHIVERVMVGI